jgi:transcriptional regulator with XRE-family HTH domain
MNSAEKLRKLRRELGLTQEQLVEKLPFELSISALRNYENINNPKLPVQEILEKLAEFYGVSTEYIKSSDECCREATITISMEEYKELLITKGKYEALKERQNHFIAPAYRDTGDAQREYNLNTPISFV